MTAWRWAIGLLVAASAHFCSAAGASERQIDTGVIRISLGKTPGSFIDEIYFDRNGDGTYAADELIAKQPANEPGIVLAYVDQPESPAGGVGTGRTIPGRAVVEKIEGDAYRAILRGTATFDGYGTSPFEVTIRSQKNSAALQIDFAFQPLKKASGLALREASLRIYGVFDNREPGTSRRSMSTGDFRNTPRPNSTYQPLVWQYGGHLVESPWYWRNWLSWSENTGPITTREGGIPPRELTFFMRDDKHGIQAAVLEPAGAAPFEFAGVGLPSNLGIFAWTPRVRPLPMNGVLPDKIELKNVGLLFFRTSLEGSGLSGEAYWKKAGEIVALAQREQLRDLLPVQSNIRDPRMDPNLREQRLKDLTIQPVRGWDAQVRATPLPAVAAPVASTAGSGTGWIELTVDGPAPPTGMPLPASGGIPFPRGALKSTEQLRLVDESGRELAFQADKLAFWPDGSIKWALITLLREPANALGKLRLEYGAPGGQRPSPRGKLAITPGKDGITVDTGALRFSLGKQMTGLFEELHFAATGNASESLVGRRPAKGDRLHRMDLLALAPEKPYAPYAFHAEGAKAEPSRVEIEEIGVERQGPVTATLLVRGRYRYETLGRGRGDAYRNDGCPFWLRYTVYAGQPYVAIKHSFVFEGNPDIEMIRDLDIGTTVELGTASFITAGIGGKASGPYPAQQGGAFQDNPHAAELWIGARDERVLAMAAEADGWMDVSDDRHGVTFGLRNMRELYAKELSVDHGRLNISLWPRRARLLDTRRYARQYGDGESTSYGQGVAQGTARSHDLFFYFHEGNASSAHSAAVAQGLQRGLIVKAPPSWYAGSKAAGPFLPFTPGQFGAWERLMADGIDYFLYHQKLWAWFGIYDFGDFQQVPDGRGGWARLAGRWGWVNNEALIDMMLYEQFMRTGRRDYLDAALALTRHTQEVDLINSDDYKGNRKVRMHGHRHNVNHWGDGYVGIRGAAPHGFRLGYYLTGDLRIYDQLRMGMESHWESMNAYDKEHSSGLGYLTFFWEATGSPIYKEALDAYLGFQSAHFRKFGSIHNGVWNFRRDQQRPLPENPLTAAPTEFFFQNFGAAYSLMELADLTGREDLRDALLQYARDTMQLRGKTWEAQYCHYRLMAFAYRHTGDPTFLRYATERADKLSVSGNSRQWSQSSAMERFDNKLSMFAWTAQGLPHLMQAIEERRNDPLPAFSLPSILPIPHGKSSGTLSVDASSSSARSGNIAAFEWQVDGKTASRATRDTFSLAPGKHWITLTAKDDQGRTARAAQAITVWEPGVVSQLCFRDTPDGFVGGEFNDSKGYGYTKGSRIINSEEPRRHGKKGCAEVLITGGARIRTGPGRFRVEMGGTDYWSESMGKIAIQGRPQDIAVTVEPGKKLSWSHATEVTVGPDGMLNIDFLPGAKGEAVVLAYIVVREARR